MANSYYNSILNARKRELEPFQNSNNSNNATFQPYPQTRSNQTKSQPFITTTSTQNAALNRNTETEFFIQPRQRQTHIRSCRGYDGTLYEPQSETEIDSNVKNTDSNCRLDIVQGNLGIKSKNEETGFLGNIITLLKSLNNIKAREFGTIAAVVGLIFFVNELVDVLCKRFFNNVSCTVKFLINIAIDLLIYIRIRSTEVKTEQQQVKETDNE